MPSLQASPHSGVFTYKLQELATRDEIVFKSVLRVLQGKTRHAWQHTDATDADVVVRSRAHAGAAPSGDFGHSQPAAHPDITISTSGSSACRVLAWPLRIADVIDCLDQAGEEIANLARRVLPGASALSSPASAPAWPCATPAPFAPSGFNGADDLPTNQRMVLTRWPGPALLQRDMRYIKLATVLTGQPVNLVEMASRTGFELQLCRSFVDALRAESLVRLLESSALPAKGPQPVAASASAAQQRASAQPGLIARIRLRLEMIVRTPAAK